MALGHVGRICFFRLSENEDLVEAIKKRVEEANVKAGMLALIGTLKNVVMGFYKNGEYKYIRLNAPLEICSCIGNVSVDEKGETAIHAHIVVSDEDGRAFGGHLMKGCLVGATAELVVVEALSVNLVRSLDEKSRLNLLKLG